MRPAMKGARRWAAPCRRPPPSAPHPRFF
jgi:hypothetical protein